MNGVEIEGYMIFRKKGRKFIAFYIKKQIHGAVLWNDHLKEDLGQVRGRC